MPSIEIEAERLADEIRRTRRQVIDPLLERAFVLHTAIEAARPRRMSADVEARHDGASGRWELPGA